MRLHVKRTLLLLALAAGMAYWVIVAHTETIALRILDERGVAVSGAVVLVSWAVDSNDSVVTDREGRVRVRGSSPYGQAEIRIQAVGHYETNLSLPLPYNCVERKCQIGTLDEISVLLKREVNPVPMYHYNIRARSPDASHPVGFDLELGDWVKPYGNGVMADFTYFHRCTIRNIQRFQAPTFEQVRQAAWTELGHGFHEVERRQIVGGRAKPLPSSMLVTGFEFPEPELQEGYEIYAVGESDLECQGEVRFANPGDGLLFKPAIPPDQPGWMTVRSKLESDHLAPEAGYQAVWTYSSKNPPKDEGKQVGYLRIRSRTGLDGRITSAWYGKVYDGNRRTVGAQKLVLDYYLNPDGTRNVEYDWQRNLGRDYTYKR